MEFHKGKFILIPHKWAQVGLADTYLDNYLQGLDKK